MLRLAGASAGLAMMVALASGAQAGGTAEMLDISKVASADPAQVGGRLVYTVTVKNLGPGSSEVLGLDALPAEVVFISATPSQGGKCTLKPRANSAGLVECPLGAIAAGGQATFTVVVNVEDLPASGTITNLCTAFGSRGPEDQDHCELATKVVEKVTPPPKEKPCIPGGTFLDIDQMKNLLGRTIDQVENGKLSDKQLTAQTKRLDAMKKSLIRLRLPTIFGVKFISVYLQLEEFDRQMAIVRRVIRVRGSDVAGAVVKAVFGSDEVGSLRRAQKELKDLETVLNKGKGVPEGTFTDITIMGNFMRRAIEGVAKGTLSDAQLTSRTMQLDNLKKAMVRKRFPTVCGKKFISVFLQLEEFDLQMETIRAVIRVRGSDVTGAVVKAVFGSDEVGSLKRAQKELKDLEAVLK